MEVSRAAPHSLVSGANVLEKYNLPCKMNKINVYLPLLNQRQVAYLKGIRCRHDMELYLSDIHWILKIKLKVILDYRELIYIFTL